MKINIIMKGIYCLFVVAAVAALRGCSSSEESAGPVQKRIMLNASIAKVEELESSEAVQSGKEHFTQGDTFTLVVANAERQYDLFDFTVGTTQLLWKEVTVAGEGAKVNFSAIRCSDLPTANSPSTSARHPNRTCCWPLPVP